MECGHGCGDDAERSPSARKGRQHHSKRHNRQEQTKTLGNPRNYGPMENSRHVRKHMQVTLTSKFLHPSHAEIHFKTSLPNNVKVRNSIEFPLHSIVHCTTLVVVSPFICLNTFFQSTPPQNAQSMTRCPPIGYRVSRKYPITKFIKEA